MILKMFLRVDLKLSTLLFFCFVFVSFWTHVLCFTCNIETWQSLNVGWDWLSDCFSRLSPNLCCLFQALSIEMCFTAEYLQRKHDLTLQRSLSCCKLWAWSRSASAMVTPLTLTKRSSAIANTSCSPDKAAVSRFWKIHYWLFTQTGVYSNNIVQSGWSW